MSKFPTAWRDVVTLYQPEHPSPHEVEVVVAKLTRFIFGNGTAPIPVEWGHRRSLAIYDGAYKVWADPRNMTWERLIRVMAWVRYHSNNFKGSAARDRCECIVLKEVVRRRWLAGTLIPSLAVEPKPSKEQVREVKIARIEARIERWEKKQQRAENALKKLHRSLNAYRRHT